MSLHFYSQPLKEGDNVSSLILHAVRGELKSIKNSTNTIVSCWDMTTISIKKDPSFLTGLYSSTWLRYPKTRGLTKHHPTKVALFEEICKLKHEIQRL